METCILYQQINRANCLVRKNETVRDALNMIGRFFVGTKRRQPRGSAGSVNGTITSHRSLSRRGTPDPPDCL